MPRCGSAAVAETITVSGETPVVDVASTKRQTTLPNELLTTAPTARSWAAMTAQIPTMTTSGGNNQDIQVTPQMIVFGGAGGRGGEGRLMADGISIGSTIGGGGSTAYIFDISNAEEVVMTNSGGLGESEVNGPSLNVVPRTGGNSLQGIRVPVRRSARLGRQQLHRRAQGRGTPARPGRSSSNGTSTRESAGPSSRDALWYFVTARDEGQHRTIPGIYPNLNAGDPARYLYVPDTTRRRAARKAGSSEASVSPGRPRRATSSTSHGTSKSPAMVRPAMAPTVAAPAGHRAA